MKGPAVFLAQFMSDSAPFDTLPSAARWMALSSGMVAPP